MLDMQILPNSLDLMVEKTKTWIYIEHYCSKYVDDDVIDRQVERFQDEDDIDTPITTIEQRRRDKILRDEIDVE